MSVVWAILLNRKEIMNEDEKSEQDVRFKKGRKIYGLRLKKPSPLAFFHSLFTLHRSQKSLGVRNKGIPFNS